MRCWVLVMFLGCGAEPLTAPAPQVASPPRVVVPEGPGRTEVNAELGDAKRVSLEVLGTGWTRVGSHLGERVLKPLCGGDVPHIGIVVDGKGGRIHVFDGAVMAVKDVLAVEARGTQKWRIWLAPVGQERPVYWVDIAQEDADTSRWRGEPEGFRWADGARWVRDSVAAGLARVERLDCEQ